MKKLQGMTAAASYQGGSAKMFSGPVLGQAKGHDHYASYAGGMHTRAAMSPAGAPKSHGYGAYSAQGDERRSGFSAPRMSTKAQTHSGKRGLPNHARMGDKGGPNPRMGTRGGRGGY